MAQHQWGELVFSVNHDAAVISRALQRGRLQRLARGIYSGNIHTPSDILTRRYLWDIVGHFFPGGVVTGPASLLADPTDCSTVYVIHTRRRPLSLASHSIVPVAGVGPQPDDIPLNEQLWLGSPARTLLWFFNQPSRLRDLARLHVWWQANVSTSQALLEGLPSRATALNMEQPLNQALAFLSQTRSQTSPIDAGKPGLAALSERSRLILTSIITHGSGTQSEMMTRLGMSKSTVSSGLQELQRQQLISTAMEKGRVNQLYLLAKESGWVLGADIGNTQVQLIARSLDGGQLALRQLTHAASAQLVKSAADAIASLRQELSSFGPLLAMTVALSKPVRPDIQLYGREGPSQAGMTPDAIMARLSLPDNTQTVVENNVNCAVVAEVRQGIAKGLKDVVFLQVGERIGSGIISGGSLIHGARGGAGEIADMPFPWSGTESPRELSLERHLAKQGFIERLNARRSSDEPVVRSLEALLARAADGEPMAMQAIERHGEQIGFLALGLVAILDPAMIVLGGSVGSHWMIVSAVRKTVAAISPYTVVAATQFGHQATVEGAVQLALEAAQIKLLGRAVGDGRLL
ncbi:ROK family transcriptional regulator [Biostraticola tofi]|uniref:Putative NBD/HSP70 family sugar kinase n=1 Tax=Biostraticola tofi TaxID=466109 RepID=A0A4R3Z6N0_9GAMM|nr:ROK family transcriptional regulator [Biostraticola tofi]TCV99679.1 putative NBD/HSP70 family sugar kinase [Biostraticola tofi]